MILKIIETERLVLRNFEESDYDDVYEFLSERKYDDFEAYPDITYENGREHLEYRVGNDEFIAIELKENKKVIGNIYSGNRDFFSKEVGYIVGKKFQRKGYGMEALKAVINNGFKSGVHRFFAECNSLNECSWKFLEKAGFEREAFFKKNAFRKKDENGNPLWQDTFVYALLNEADL